MGGGGSQSINQTFDMSAINKSVYEQTTINENTATASQANIQSMQIDMKNIVGCTTNITQNVTAEVNANSELTNDQTTAIKTAITTEMQAAVEAQLEKVTEAGNFQFGDKQNMNQSLALAIENTVKNSIITENINKAVGEQVTIQDGIYTIDGYDCTLGGEINYSQDITAQVVASIVTKNLSDSIASTEVFNDLQAAADAAGKTENKGIADIIDSIGDLLAGPLKWIALACVCCVCVLVIGAVVMGMSPAGQNATRNMSKAAASKF
tara:strand:- start:45 stop:842 length:798 start_codon:yes stop_codon:yes gene_type:complete